MIPNFQKNVLTLNKTRLNQQTEHCKIDCMVTDLSGKSRLRGITLLELNVLVADN